MLPETTSIKRVGRNEITIERYVDDSDGKPYTFEGSDYDYETLEEAELAALERDQDLCREQNERWDGFILE